MENQQDETTINYQYYLLDKQYKEYTNLVNYVNEAQDFYNGNQYPDNNQNNNIRVTLNICSFSSNLKAAKIVGTPTYIQYTSDTATEDACIGLQRFDEYNLSKLNEKTENFQTALNSLNNGTGVVMYRWDPDAITYKGIYRGGLVLEQIDILRFAVANPHLQEIQNQKWIMYWVSQDIAGIRDLVERSDEKEKERIKAKIKPDANTARDEDKANYISHGLATLYTRYFRIKGEVCFMVSTKNVDIYEYPHFLSPIANGKMKKYVKKLVDDYKEKLKKDKDYDPDKPLDFSKITDYEIDYEQVLDNSIEKENYSIDDYEKDKEKFYLYPFAVYEVYKIDNSFYGRSDVKQIIPTQKGINFALSMMLKCIENNAYNKVFAKEDALEGQEINNEPGQVIIDHTKMTNSWGIKFAESQPMPNGMIDFIERFIGLTRVFGGFNDVMDGSITNQDLSGYAVQQMIKQANSSIEQQQQLFWKFLKDKAAIRLTFYKFYVDKAKYTYQLEDYTVDSEEQARKILKKAKNKAELNGQQLEIGDVNLDSKTQKTQIREIKGKDLYGSNFDISIDVMQGLSDSKLAEAQMWDNLILNGNIANMDPELLDLYFKANPNISEHTKQAVDSIVKTMKQSENYQLKQQLNDLVQKASKLAEYTKELEAQNGYKSNYIQALMKEFTDKINVANKLIKMQNDSINTKTTQVDEGAGKSNNARGISGSDITTTVQ